MLEENRDEVSGILEDAEGDLRRANPAYEEMEGIVAGVASLADYDVIIDAGSSGEEPESAVPFDLKLPNGKTLKQPGKFMFLTETALCGTTTTSPPRAWRPDLERKRQGRVRRGAPRRRTSSSRPRAISTSYARELDTEANAFEPMTSEIPSQRS